MSVFPSWPWTNFHEENLDWVIKTVKESKQTVKEKLDWMSKTVTECKQTVEEALADVSVAVATYFAGHIDTTLTRSGEAADAAAVGQKITNLNSNYTTLNGTVNGLTTKVGNKADAIVIDGDNRAFLKGNYTTLHTLLEDNHKSVDVWVKSGTVYYKALQVAGGPDNRVIIRCKYADNRFHYLGCEADNTITGIKSDPSYCVIFDITNNTVVNDTKAGAYLTIKTMYDNYGPYDIVVKISNFDQAIPYNVWFNGMDTLKITYRDSTDTKHTISLTRSGTMTVA